MELSMKDYQEPRTMTKKMYYLPPSNKKEFVMEVDGDFYRLDTGLQPDIVMKTIQRLKAREKQLEAMVEDIVKE